MANESSSLAGGRNVCFCEAGTMNGETQIDPAGRVGRLSLKLNSLFVSLIFLLSCGVFTATAQTARPAYGATSAQDRAKRAAPAATGSDAADQVCARFAAGSVVSAPSELKSQNGVLEVTFTFQTVTDTQGLVRYCYVTNTGLEAPTLRVNPGDQLIIHFTNNLPAASASNAADNMAGMKMTLSAKDEPTTSTSSACNGAMSAERCRQMQPTFTFTEPM
jgi:hypothetical protein